MKLIEEDLDLEKTVIMVQKEVAIRFSAKPGSKDYSSISVFLDIFSSLYDQTNYMNGEKFNHQIAYEIRLQQAMEENLLCYWKAPTSYNRIGVYVPLEFASLEEVFKR